MGLFKSLIKSKVTQVLFAKVDYINGEEIEHEANFYSGVHLTPVDGREKLGAFINSDEDIHTGRYYVLVGYYLEYEETKIFFVMYFHENFSQQLIKDMAISNEHKIYLRRLNKIINSIENKSTRQLLNNVFDSPEILLPFLVLPASSQHHHSYQFGLIQHSLECSEFTQNALNIHNNQDEVDICVAASLLHDTGKIKTLQEERKLTQMGVYIQHDILTLFILQPFLKKMEEEWSIGAAALMYMLTWDRNKDPIPKHCLSVLVKASDYISVANNLSQDAFQDKPDYFHYSAMNMGEKTFFMNRLTPPSNYLKEDSLKSFSDKKGEEYER